MNLVQSSLTMKMEGLTILFDIRNKRLSEERVLLFQNLYTSDVSVPPIQIGYVKTGDPKKSSIWDGRTRYEARKQLGALDLVVDVTEFEDEHEMLMAAFKANLSEGPLAPGPEDYRLLVKALLKQNKGYDKESLLKEFEAMGLQSKFAANMIDYALRQRLQEDAKTAAALVIEGETTLYEAANKFGLTPDSVRKQLEYNWDRFQEETKGLFGKTRKSIDSSLAKLCKSVAGDLTDAASLLHQEIESLQRYIDSSLLPTVPPQGKKKGHDRIV